MLEYNDLFESAGDVTVKVKFANKNDAYRSLPKRKTNWGILQALLELDSSDSPPTLMLIDGYCCKVERFEIHPGENMIIIVIESILAEPGQE